MTFQATSIGWSWSGQAASGIGAALSRLDNIASSGSPSSSDKYAAYTYLGAATVVKVAHPGVTDGLNLTYGTDGSYGGFDQFGRIIDQKWENGSSTVKERFTYGYDRNSNRLYRKNEHTSGRHRRTHLAASARASDGHDGAGDGDVGTAVCLARAEAAPPPRCCRQKLTLQLTPPDPHEQKPLVRKRRRTNRLRITTTRRRGRGRTMTTRGRAGRY